MKKAIVVAALSLTLAGSAFAVDSAQAPKGGANLEQKRAEILKMLEEEKTCVQAAKSHDDLKVCRDKAREAMKEGVKKEKAK